MDLIIKVTCIICLKSCTGSEQFTACTEPSYVDVNVRRITSLELLVALKTGNEEGECTILRVSLPNVMIIQTLFGDLSWCGGVWVNKNSNYLNSTSTDSFFVIWCPPPPHFSRLPHVFVFFWNIHRL